MTKTIATALILFATLNIAYANPLNSAFERMNNFNKQDWSYQISTDAERQRLELYDPRNNPNWTLVSLDNEPPTKKQRASYQDDKTKEAEGTEETEEAEGDKNRLNLHKMIDVSSLTLVNESRETGEYTFKPIVDEESIADSLTGTLWHNKQLDYIERFEFRNVSEFSPMFGIKIKKMYTSFRFKQISEDIFAPDQINTEVAGRAFGLKKIDEKESQTYQSYKVSE